MVSPSATPTTLPANSKADAVKANSRVRIVRMGFTGRNEGGLLRGVAVDFALGQRLLQFSNLRFGEVGVSVED